MESVFLLRELPVCVEMWPPLLSTQHEMSLEPLLGRLPLALLSEPAASQLPEPFPRQERPYSTLLVARSAALSAPGGFAV